MLTQTQAKFAINTPDFHITKMCNSVTYRFLLLNTITNNPAEHTYPPRPFLTQSGGDSKCNPELTTLWRLECEFMYKAAVTAGGWVGWTWRRDDCADPWSTQFPLLNI